MSTSEYKSSSSPSESPTPSSRNAAPRRSGRSKNQPATYNLRVLSGLDKETNETSDNSEEESLPQMSDVPSLSRNPPSTLPPADGHIVRRSPNIPKFIWNRELRGCNSNDQFHSAVNSDLKPWRWWKGASNDVVALAWSPDGTKFAAGATAQSDEYNRGNNLILGDIVQSSLHELPDHWVPRSVPSSVSDERLFTSVTSVEWVEQHLYTASYDHTVKIWDVGSHQRPSCIQTLRHESQVVVMALSSAMPNLIATGSNAFGLWDVREDQNPGYMALPICRDSRQRADIDLAPTNLAWGHTAETKRYLVGGMVQRIPDEYKVAPCGHLALWSLEESIPILRKVTPDSQNIFDVKWHPCLPRFATATTSSPAMSLPPGTRSVVSVYDFIQSGEKTLVTSQFPCPALDINEVTFCPMDSTYVTASCTDGNTYVWDARNPGNILHRLQHGDPLSPLNHEYHREVTDFGVSVALWGTSIGQFVTGGSDGVLKQWDIRLSSEDALVANIASFEDGITSGAFSEDKSHLVVGEHGGGVRVLSSGPYADTDTVTSTPKESDPTKFGFTPAPCPSDSVSGIEIAKKLLSSDQLLRDPIYGPVQGPCYEGPYAQWARNLKKNTPSDQIGRVPLLEKYQLRQFSGPPVEDRHGLDKDTRKHIRNQILIAMSRNARPLGAVEPGIKKRKRETCVNTESDDEIRHVQGPNSNCSQPKLSDSKKKKKKKKPNGEKEKRKRKKKRHQSLITNIETGVIDLTGDSPEPETLFDGSLFHLESLEEDLEEDYWWPESGYVDANIHSSDSS
ncbi:uncharacterized protein N7459_006726 [Penicillium hispanicum]|uniref:uncharacterized protein n=1 Tax=Penicillium hispanicum TaxID=1080232 RepID=UPI00254191D6|nr:uncharacterized protein N7459_006726 [Penicillium hispanicum]KAJ5577762.1 hypothetical protein N7459_006726 [Penicillium hispanicum]